MTTPIGSFAPRGAPLLLLLSALAACQPKTGTDASLSANPVTPPTDEATVPMEGPCRLLTVGEVRAVLPQAGAGKRDESRSQYGIDACIWEDANGRFAVQTWQAKSGSVDNEIRGLTAGFIDPLNRAAQGNVRFEAVADVGEQAMAVVETQDAQRGILSDVAMLVTRRGDRIIVLMTDSVLARRERSESLGILQKLGHAAAQRD